MDQKAYNAEYRRLNKKQLRDKQRAYRKANKEALNLRNRRYYHTNESYRMARQEKMKTYKRAWRLEKMYNLTTEQYEALLEKQDRCCAICKSGVWGEGKRNIPHIDHDHATGLVRGLLCKNCNHGLGMFRDSPVALSAAANYLLNQQHDNA